MCSWALRWWMLVPMESKYRIYVDFAARQRLQNTSARPKEKFKLEFERHGVSVEDDNDFIHPIAQNAIVFRDIYLQFSGRQNNLHV